MRFGRRAREVRDRLHVAQQHLEAFRAAVEVDRNLAVLVLRADGEHVVATAVGDLRRGLVRKLEDVQRQVLAVVVVRLLVVRADRDDRILAGQQRQGEEVVVLAHPAAADLRLVREQVRPLAVRQVIRHVAVLREHRRDQQAVAEHVLAVEVLAGDVAREFEHHGAHRRHAGLMRVDGRREHVRHQRALELGELLDDRNGLFAVLLAFLAEQPRHAVGVGAVESRMRGEQAERRPALVDVGRGRALEAAHVVAPEAEAGQAQREAAAQGLGHRSVVRGAVAAPVHRELLAADRRAAREEAGLVLALVRLKQVENALVVEIRVVVVHADRVAAVVVDDVDRDSFAEVGLEAVDALVEQLSELRLVPLAGVRVREVDKAHAGLPQVALPDVAVRLLQQVAEVLRFLEQRGLLADIRVDPHTDLEILFLLHDLELVVDIREHRLVPVEVAPLVLLHPVAVEVEHVQRDVALRHAVDELHDGLLVVLRREGGGQPQAEGPCRRKRGLAGKVRVVLEHLLHVGAADDHEVDLLARHGELHARDLLGADLIRDRARVVDEHAVVAVRHIERDALVGDFGAGAAVLVPGFDALAVLHKRGEALAEAVDLLADVEIHLDAHEAVAAQIFGIFVAGDAELHLVGEVAVVLGVDRADHRVAEAVADARQLFVLIVIREIAGILRDDELRVATLDRDFLLAVFDLERAMQVVQLERGHLLVAAHEVVGLHADDIRLGGGNEHFKHRAAHGAHVHRIRNRVEIHAVVFDLDFSDLDRVGIRHAVPVDPVALREFHKLTAFQKNCKIP